jgi:hypothetical protein
MARDRRLATAVRQDTAPRMGGYPASDARQQGGTAGVKRSSIGSLPRCRPASHLLDVVRVEVELVLRDAEVSPVPFRLVIAATGPRRARKTRPG